MGYRGKRMLILGGISHMIDIVRTAKSMGIYTIVTDYSENSPAKSIADKFYNVSTTDIDTILKIAENEKIDGVINAFEDLNVWVAQKVCEKLNLPFYASKQQLDIITNKKRFKEFCRNHEVPVVDEYFSGGDLNKIDFKQIKFPVIVKPVDSYGSKGISISHTKEELIKSLKKAIQYSKSEQCIIEKFIDNDYGVEMYYTAQNGNITLSAMTDRYVYRQDKTITPLPISTIFPSNHLNEYCKTVDKKVRNMLKKMKIENGVISIQALIEDGKFYIYEMAYRLTGEQHYQIVEKQTKVNLLKMMIALALGEDIKQYNISQYDNGYTIYPSCNLSMLLKPGKIKEISGIDQLKQMKQVISYVQTCYEGDEITTIGNYGQMFMRINIYTKSKKELSDIIYKVNESISVISEENEDMLVTKYKYIV